MLMKIIRTTAGRSDLIAIPSIGIIYPINSWIIFQGNQYKCIVENTWTGSITADWEIAGGGAIPIATSTTLGGVIPQSSDFEISETGDLTVSTSLLDTKQDTLTKGTHTTLTNNIVDVITGSEPEQIPTMLICNDTFEKKGNTPKSNTTDYEYIGYDKNDIYPNVDQSKIAILDGRVETSIVSGAGKILLQHDLVSRDDENVWRRDSQFIFSDPRVEIKGNIYNKFSPYRMRQHTADHTNTVESGGLGNVFSDEVGHLIYKDMVVKSGSNSVSGQMLKFTLIFLENTTFNGTTYEISNLYLSNAYNSSNGTIFNKVYGNLIYYAETFNANGIDIYVLIPDNQEPLDSKKLYLKCDIIGSGAQLSTKKTVLTFNLETANKRFIDNSINQLVFNSFNTYGTLLKYDTNSEVFNQVVGEYKIKALVALSVDSQNEYGTQLSVDLNKITPETNFDMDLLQVSVDSQNEYSTQLSIISQTNGG